MARPLPLTYPPAMSGEAAQAGAGGVSAPTGTAKHPVPHSALTDLIGNTPLLPIVRNNPFAPRVNIFAKAEWFNPGGSVKDRPAWNMVRRGFEEGKLTRDKTLLDATSGNTGIAYAMLGAALGFKVKLCLPQNASPERKKILAAYGVELVITDPGEGSDGAIRMARKLAAEHPDRYFYPDQYGNPANWQAHYHTTANEIWEQTEGKITHFIAGLGTSGTFCGTTRRLKELNPKIRCISFEPDAAFHGLEGLKHMETAIVPGIYDDTLADDNLGISTEASQDMTLCLARREGLLTGISSGGAMVAALKVAKEFDGEAVIVTVFPDGGDKYLSEPYWERATDDGECTVVHRI